MALPPEQLETLASVVQETIEITRQLESSLTETETSTKLSRVVTDPLALAGDATRLVKAHATKLCLLVINEPFTPKAIISVLRELAAGPQSALAALAAAVQGAPATRYTTTFHDELVYRARRVILEVRKLVETVPRDGPAAQFRVERLLWRAKMPKDSVATTGTLWHACDEAVLLASAGPGELLAGNISWYQKTVADVQHELKRWMEDCDDELEKLADMEKRGEDVGAYEAERDKFSFDSEDDDDNEDKADDASTLANDLSALTVDDKAQAFTDKFMSQQSYILYGDPGQIRPRLVCCIRRLRLVTLLYRSVAVRRLATAPLPNDGKAPSVIEDVALLLRELRDKVQGLAEDFYNLDGAAIDATGDECWQDAISVAEMLAKSWDGGEDHFTEWAEKFKVEVRKS